MDRLQENLSRAIELSRRIIDLGRDEAWDEIDRLDRERLQLLQAVFENRAELAAAGEPCRSQLESILELNEEALDICRQARQTNMDNSRAVKRGLDAITAYHKQIV
ncbi:MAG: hypothetical protein P8103_16585 [Candidatus Thiodiazotropha sp.]